MQKQWRSTFLSWHGKYLVRSPRSRKPWCQIVAGKNMLLGAVFLQFLSHPVRWDKIYCMLNIYTTNASGRQCANGQTFTIASMRFQVWVFSMIIFEKPTKSDFWHFKLLGEKKLRKYFKVIFFSKHFMLRLALWIPRMCCSAISEESRCRH